MSLEYPNVIHAAGSVNADGTLAGGAGFSSANTGAGVYELTLDRGLADAQCGILATIHLGGINGQCVTAHVSDSVKQIQTRVGGVLANAPFDVLILCYPRN